MGTNLNHDEIYKTLENEIVLLKILPGEMISENSLCKRFNISRTPIRSVLQRLQQKGFVQIVPCRGTIVTTVNIQIASQWIYQRWAVESMVLKDFINCHTPEDIAWLHHLQKELRKIPERAKETGQFDLNEFLTMDFAAHQVWFRRTDKMYLWNQLTQPQPDYSRFIRLDVVRGRNVPDVLAEHEELIRLIEEKDGDAIVALLKRHLYGGIRRMGSELFSEEYEKYFSPSSERK